MAGEPRVPPEYLAALLRVSEQVSRAAANLSEQIAPATKVLAEWEQHFGAKTSAMLQQIERGFRDLPEQNRRAARILAARGWYIDPNSSPRETMIAVDMFEKDEIGEAHEYMCWRMNEEADSLLEMLVTQCPERERLLKSAFNAHKRGDY